ncbi:MAG: hypothetical protein ACK476_15135 [Fluviicola sp.]
MRLYLFILAIIVTNSIYSQEKIGFYGKRNFIDVSLNLHTNTLLKTFTSGYSNNSNGFYYKANGNSLKREELSIIQTEYLVSVGRQFRPRFAFSINLKYGLHNMYNVSTVNNYLNNDYLLNYTQFESKKYSTFSIVPMFSFNKGGISAPSGAYMQFGIGPLFYKVNDTKSYTAKESSAGYQTNSSALVDETKKGIVFCFGIGNRKSISKSLAINYGIQVHYNYSKTDFYYSSTFTSTTFTKAVLSDIGKDIKTRFVSANIGLSYIF